MAHITEKWWTLQEKSFFITVPLLLNKVVMKWLRARAKEQGYTYGHFTTTEYFKQTLLFSRITKQFLQTLNWCSQSRKRQKSGLKKWALFFSCSFFQAFNYSGHSVKNGQRKYKEVEREKVSSLSNTTLLPYFCSPVWPVPQLTEHLKETIFPDDDFVASYQ